MYGMARYFLPGRSRVTPWWPGQPKWVWSEANTGSVLWRRILRPEGAV